MKHTNNKLSPCPNSPNCVSTQSTDKRHKIEPIEYKISSEDALNKVISIIKSIERTKIISEDMDYLKVEFRSKVFRFVDDVEFYFDDQNKTLHFRSASRVGYGDMGVNRKRMEKIRRLFNA